MKNNYNPWNARKKDLISMIFIIVIFVLIVFSSGFGDFDRQEVSEQTKNFLLISGWIVYAITLIAGFLESTWNDFVTNRGYQTLGVVNSFTVSIIPMFFLALYLGTIKSIVLIAVSLLLVKELGRLVYKKKIK